MATKRRVLETLSFEDKMGRRTAELYAQFAEAAKLVDAICENLGLGHGD